MANSEYLKRKVESHIREWAAGQLNVAFLTKQKMIVGHNSVGEPVRFEFDGVSDDGSIGVCISASTSYKAGQKHKLFMDATLLNRVSSFRRRVMIFLDKKIWERFSKDFDGKVDLIHIEPLFCLIGEMPEEMQQEISRFKQKAVEEVSGKLAAVLELSEAVYLPDDAESSIED